MGTDITSKILSAQEFDDTVNHVNKAGLLSIAPAISSSTGSMANIDTTTQELYVPVDIVLLTDTNSYPLPSAVTIDLTAATSSAKKVFYSKSTGSFVTLRYDASLSQLQKIDYLLFAVIRTIGRVTVDCSVPCSINGAHPTLDLAGTVRIATAKARSLIDFNTLTKTLTIPHDTILHYANKRFVVTGGLEVLTSFGTSTLKWYWNTANNTIKAVEWSTTLSAEESASSVLIAASRQSPALSGSLIQEAHLSINCNYTINGRPNSSTPVDNPKNANILALAHRGLSKVAPENTKASCLLAKKMGFNIIETDVSWTSDGVPVLLHDETIDRTSNSTGLVINKTLADLELLDFGSWKSTEFANERILTFEAFLKLCKQLGMDCYPEVKGVATNAQLDTLLQITKDTGMLNHTTFISFRISDISYIASAEHTAKIGYIAGVADAQSITDVSALKTVSNEVSLLVSNASLATNMPSYRASGLKVISWTVNTHPDLAISFDNGVDGVITDWLNIALLADEANGLYS